MKTGCITARKFHLCHRCKDDILPGQEYKTEAGRKFHHSPDCGHAKPGPLITIFESLAHHPYGKFPPVIWRFVRTTPFRRARRDYDCWRCITSPSIHRQFLSTIFAHDEYYAEYYVSRLGWQIRRFHHPCCPAGPWDEDLELEEEDAEETPSSAAEDKAA